MQIKGVTWEGDSVNGREITGVDFMLDLILLKRQNNMPLASVIAGSS
jgi:hypothetical protein